MQGGMKACPRCGTVNDSANETCESCDYNFTTGDGGSTPPRIIAEGEGSTPPRIFAEGEVPRIEIDDSSIKGGTNLAAGRRVIAVVVAAVFVLIAGIGVYVAVAVKDTVDQVRTPFEIDLPDGGTIVIPTNFGNERTFTRESCTSELQRGLTDLLRTQARNEPLNDLFLQLTDLGVGSFEYRTLIQIYSDFDIQTELATGSKQKAITTARDDAAEACRRHYV